MSLTGEAPRAICLPRGVTANNTHVGERAIVTIRDTSNTKNLELQEITVPVVMTNICKQKYQKLLRRPLGGGHLCAGGEKGIDACLGDGGGALFVPGTVRGRYQLLATVSYGANPCGREGWPAVYSKTAYYVPWILNTIRE